jgi:hypothetical protein
MLQVLIFVSAVLFLSIGCGESEALNSAGAASTPEVIVSPLADITPISEVEVSSPSEHPSAKPATLVIREFADAFNKHQ